MPCVFMGPNNNQSRSLPLGGCGVNHEGELPEEGPVEVGRHYGQGCLREGPYTSRYNQLRAGVGSGRIGVPQLLTFYFGGIKAASEENVPDMP